MTEILYSADVYIKDTDTVKGRGAFADRDFSAGECVEVAPVIILLMPFDQLPPRLKTRVYNWGSLTGCQASSALVLGFGSLYNHANPANMRYEADNNNGTMRYIAMHDISKGEELSVNYNGPAGEAVSQRDDWFEKHNITLLDGDS